jgi:hypothetical protein
MMDDERCLHPESKIMRYVIERKGEKEREAVYGPYRLDPISAH